MVQEFGTLIGNEIGTNPPTLANFEIRYRPTVQTQGSLDRLVTLRAITNGSSDTVAYREPGPTVGSGTGVLGTPRSHLDTYYEPANGLYYLQDVSRRESYQYLTHSQHGLGIMPGPTTGRAIGSSILVQDPWYAVFSDPDNQWGGTVVSGAAGDAHVHTGMVYDFLLYGLDWVNSFDGAGGSMIAEIDPLAEDEASHPKHERKVVFGAGSQYPAPSAALDMVGHEWAHALMEFYCNLNPDLHGPEFEALAEAFSDWFGTAVEHHWGESNWTFGEGVNLYRDMANPSVAWYRSPGWYQTTSKYEKAGVANRMFYLLVKGDQQLGIQAVPIETAIRIAVDSCNGPWKEDTTFPQARQSMIQVAGAYGAGVQESLRRAWDAVGVTEAVSNPSCFLQSALFLLSRAMVIDHPRPDQGQGN